MISTIQLVVYPSGWSEHIVWGSILPFLLTRGPGAVPLDHLIAQASCGRRGAAVSA
jgi:putative oxidoreductase